MNEKTLSIIKPDAVGRNLTGAINMKIEQYGFHIIAQKRILLTKKNAQQFYIEHKDRPFYQGLVEYMTSGPVVVQVLKKSGAVVDYRKLMGATNPADAEDGSIRKEFAIDIEQNSVHGSDSDKTAQREIAFFFAQIELN